jgi:hypothetical protein
MAEDEPSGDVFSSGPVTHSAESIRATTVHNLMVELKGVEAKK